MTPVLNACTLYWYCISVLNNKRRKLNEITDRSKKYLLRHYYNDIKQMSHIAISNHIYHFLMWVLRVNSRYGITLGTWNKEFVRHNSVSLNFRRTVTNQQNLSNSWIPVIFKTNILTLNPLNWEEQKNLLWCIIQIWGVFIVLFLWMLLHVKVWVK